MLYLTYIIKEIEKLVACRYGVIMHLGNVGRILEKRVKNSAPPRVLHVSLVFFQHSPRALAHDNSTRLVFYFVINELMYSHLGCLISQIYEYLLGQSLSFQREA